MAPTPVTEPCLVLFWCWILPSGDLTPAKSFLEQTAQSGRVLENAVTERKFLGFHPDMNSSSPLTYNQLYQPPAAWNIGTILARPPPTHPLPAIIFHNNHDKGIRHRVADT
ncbi:hypothetical protein COH20_004756, partial [Aspergillus flavus]